MLTLLETVTSSLVARGLNPDSATWDAWRNEDGRWTVQLGWKAGRSDNLAHFRFCPGSHGGTVTAVDDAASELIDPELRPSAAAAGGAGRPARLRRARALPAPVAAPVRRRGAQAVEPRAARRGKPAVPAWEDVLLGVRSSGQR